MRGAILEPRDLVRRLCVGAIGAVIVALGAASAAAATSTPDPGVRVLRVPAGQTNVKLRWEADVRGPRGEFLLLRGTDSQSLRVFARVAAHDAGEYGVVDISAAAGARVYQLRYLDPRGIVHVLATQEILVETEVRSAALWTTGSPHPDVTMLASASLPSLDRAGTLERSFVPRSTPLGPEPPTPPPRGLDRARDLLY